MVNYQIDLALFLGTETNRRFEFIPDMPMLNDDTVGTDFDAHYIYHPAWAARVIQKINPKKHIDISSKLEFGTIISAFIDTDFYDYRPANITNLTGYKSNYADLLNLPFEDNSIESISCMHTIEHIGLGRYGDKIDYDGDLKAIQELKRVCAPNGNIIFVVPIGKPVIRFNAHRIYSAEQIASYFTGFSLEEFALITDENKFIINPSMGEVNKQKYGCGCFWFKKNGLIKNI